MQGIEENGFGSQFEVKNGARRGPQSSMVALGCAKEWRAQLSFQQSLGESLASKGRPAANQIDSIRSICVLNPRTKLRMPRHRKSKPGLLSQRFLYCDSQKCSVGPWSRLKTKPTSNHFNFSLLVSTERLRKPFWLRTFLAFWPLVRPFASNL